jgi:hypothetical protein
VCLPCVHLGWWHDARPQVWLVQLQSCKNADVVVQHATKGEGRVSRWDCLHPLLSTVQALHTEADAQAVEGSFGPCRLSLPQRPGVHVHQILSTTT